MNRKCIFYTVFILIFCVTNGYAQNNIMNFQNIKQVERPGISTKNTNVQIKINGVSGFGKEGAAQVEKILLEETRNCVCIPNTLNIDKIDVFPMTCWCQKHGTDLLKIKDSYSPAPQEKPKTKK
jgi:hypothetical protein